MRPADAGERRFKEIVQRPTVDTAEGQDPAIRQAEERLEARQHACQARLGEDPARSRRMGRRGDGW